MTGATLGHYRLHAELGSGGMGTVWRAEGADGAVVALKVVHDHVAATPGFLERFLREGEVGKSVRHENVVATLATGEDRGANGVRHWIALEYVEGQTLRGLADEMGTVPEELCRHVGREIAKGLGAIHAAGLLHRDVKPENVIISRCTAPGHDHVAERPGAQRRVGEGNVPLPCDHVVKVMDLGIARGADDDQRMTATGMFVGSVQYAAPEQFTGGGKGLDARTDLHALGVTLYELATGVQPFLGDDVSETLRNVLHVVPRRAGEVNPQLSAFFEEVLRTLLEKAREKRFASAGELLEVLTQGEDSAWWEERARAIRAATRKPLRRIRIPRETALYGREAELAKLRAAYDRAAAGEGAVLLVEGEAGIGKSRLVDEFVGGLAQSGEDVNFLFGGYPPGGAATASGAFSTAWREHFGNDEDALRAALPEQPLLVPAFAALLRGDAPPPGAEPLTKDSLQTVFVRSAQSLAKERVTIVLVEDLHFAPEEGRALFASLAMATPGHRILLVGTLRSGTAPDCGAALARIGAERIELSRLEPHDLVRLLADALRSAHAAEDLAGRVAAASDGNPYFVLEIIAALRDAARLTQRSDGSWTAAGTVVRIEVPGTVRELVRSRLDGLDRSDRDLLEAAACQGFGFDARIVGAVLGLARIPLLQRLAHLERSRRLVRSAGRGFVFDHHQVRECLHEAIPDLLREEYHAAIGAEIERETGLASRSPAPADGAACAEVADHLLRGGRGAQALRYADAALGFLERTYANDPMLDLADRFLAAPGLVTGARRVDLLVRSATRLGFRGDRAGQRAALAEALDVARDGELTADVARAETNLGVCDGEEGRWDEAVARHRRAVAAARSAGNLAVEAAALSNLASALHRQRRLEDALACYEEGLRAAESCGHAPTVAGCEGGLGHLLQELGRFDEALARLARQEDLARRSGDRLRQSTAAMNRGRLHSMRGRSAEAEGETRRASAIAREIGHRPREAQLATNLGVLALARGDAEEAMARFDRALLLAQEMDELRTEMLAAGGAACARSMGGRWDEACGLLDRQQELARRLGDARTEGEAACNRSVVLKCLGRLAESHAEIDRAVRIAHDARDRRSEGFFLANRADANVTLGLLEAARADLDAARRLEDATSDRRGLAVAAGNECELAWHEGRDDDAERFARAKLDAARAMSEETLAAEALCEVALLCAARGADGDARTAAREALDGARSVRNDALSLLASAVLASVDGSAREAAEAEYARCAATSSAHVRMRILFLLGRATRNRAHLGASREILDRLVANAPPAHRGTMRERNRLHREILEACAAEGIA